MPRSSGRHDGRQAAPSADPCPQSGSACRPGAGLRAQVGVGAVPSPVEADTTFAKERDDDLECFLEAPDAMVEREVERLELRFVPATTEPEHQSSAADLVESKSPN